MKKSGLNTNSVLTTTKRPVGVTALSIFFLAGALICLIAVAALLFPNSFLGPIWRLNPRGHAGFVIMGLWAIILLISVSAACAVAAVGLWRGAKWGHVIAVFLIAINLIGDIVNVALGTELRAIVGIPIAGLLLIYLLSRRVRCYFREKLDG